MSVSDDGVKYSTSPYAQMDDTMLLHASVPGDGDYNRTRLAMAIIVSLAKRRLPEGAGNEKLLTKANDLTERIKQQQFSRNQKVQQPTLYKLLMCAMKDTSYPDPARKSVVSGNM